MSRRGEPPRRSPEQRALLAGGVAYFADPTTPLTTTPPRSGFEDDVQMVSAIARALGVAELARDAT